MHRHSKQSQGISRMKTKGKPTLIDQVVGRNVRKRRKELGISQEMLASCINVSFQQIQKYENGKNRISAGTLLIFSKVLRHRIVDFYKGADIEYDAATGDLKITYESNIKHD